MAYIRRNIRMWIIKEIFLNDVEWIELFLDEFDSIRESYEWDRVTQKELEEELEKLRNKPV